MMTCVGLSRCWALGAWFALCAHCAVDMFTLAFSKLTWADLSVPQLLAAAAIVVFFIYYEAYKGFYKGFSPVLVRRTMAIDEGSPWYVHALGPFCIGGFFDGTRRRLAVSWGLVVAIGLLGYGTARSPYPWRQFIDLGVGVGLTLGVVSMAHFTALAARGVLPKIDGQFAVREGTQLKECGRSLTASTTSTDDIESAPTLSSNGTLS
jgi:hypothetical protein